MSTLSASIWATIAEEAAAESQIWREALRPDGERELDPIFSSLGREEHALGLETIYEGYLVHYGRPRLFEPQDRDTALLLGDYLYAHGLVRIASLGSTVAVHDLAELISVCARLRGEMGPPGSAQHFLGKEDEPGDGIVWAATALALGTGALAEPRAVYRETGDLDAFAALVHDADAALARHAERVSYAR